jgi:hypothetical protein
MNKVNTKTVSYPHASMEYAVKLFNDKIRTTSFRTQLRLESDYNYVRSRMRKLTSVETPDNADVSDHFFLFVGKLIAALKTHWMGVPCKDAQEDAYRTRVLAKYAEVLIQGTYEPAEYEPYYDTRSWLSALVEEPPSATRTHNLHRNSGDDAHRQTA